ncbi:MAG: hypothetical protein IJ298_06330 [Ruminococcus sp.]|nr:hypothetical protein [Ruminococcus sp.]
MKRLLVQLLLVIMCVCLVLTSTACNGSGDNDTTTTGVQNTTASENTQEGDSTVAAGATEQPASPSERGDADTAAVVPESAKVSADYFDNTAFVGDSVSLKLSYYAAATGALGKAQFFTAGSLGCANALWEVSDESVHPSYQGTKMLVEDCVAASGADTLYIMLGMNDIGLYGIDDTIENYKTLLGKITAKSPQIKIVVQSMTPMTETSTILGDSLNNENIKIYNSCLSQMCSDNGWAFVDVASVMYDAQGVNLNRDFCSDPDGLGVHFTEAGCEKWVEYLSTHTP